MDTVTTWFAVPVVLVDAMVEDGICVAVLFLFTYFILFIYLFCRFGMSNVSIVNDPSCPPCLRLYSDASSPEAFRGMVLER